ncbi:L-glyceraldehyde 3-phosphate reductase [Paenibacillus pectinilyticus]|uniref:L-glyceraldehyde 3-phosphate reductase n=1 Tax=Paenibacillus pectinilyticus TaxID=512399 RepID=A0A1C1A3P0_9BACL|nr:L-glyceraldehyde 3-phosphate reductase [Paenibacillus pectinilyticus]OCT15165.1 L-glyceraldehyde 3-phosphate reductase [Paenibacillus pectinilyticus]
MRYAPKNERYSNMRYTRCGNSGLKLPAISLGLWQNYGSANALETQRDMLRRAFDLGITHFDLANNYGPPPGTAEENFGSLFKADFKPYRDELILSTKAGNPMWNGPYGDGGSKKHMITSLDQSLKRMGLDYVDIFYSHRCDPETPMEETMRALDLAVKQGKALFVGVSNYSAEQTKQAAGILKKLGTPCLIHQPKYNMFDRWIENELQDVLKEEGMGSIAFSPLAKGLLTSRYLTGIPADSRAASASRALSVNAITDELMSKIIRLNAIALERDQSLSQMVIAWVLRVGKVTSALIGASKVSQIEDNVAALKNLDFSQEELLRIDEILSS